MTDSLLRRPDRVRPPREDPGVPDEASDGLVVVGVDDGPLPCGLLEHALMVALRQGAAVGLVHVHGPGSPIVPWEDAATRAAGYLTRAAPLTVIRRCVPGDPVEALVAAADPAGTLVLAARYPGPGPGAGRTPDAVIGSALCPVLVVDDSVPPPPADGGVVVGLDGAADAATVLLRALAAAAELATGVRAVSSATTAGGAPVVGLAAAVATAGRAFPQVPVTLERTDDGTDRRLLAASRGAALLVLDHRHPVASERRGGDRTASTVLTAPPCPVLVLGPRVPERGRPGAEGPRGAGRRSARG